jgi:hypothetical protein
MTTAHPEAHHQAAHQDANCIHAVPAQWLERGFRLLTLRELHAETQPPAFAWIEQRLLRTPERLSRHGLYFGNTFRPEVMAWLIEHLGRPSVRDSDDGPARRNASWPALAWHREIRAWPEGFRTMEWFVDVIFPAEAHWNAFRQHWLDRLLGKADTPRERGADKGAADLQAHNA